MIFSTRVRMTPRAALAAFSLALASSLVTAGVAYADHGGEKVGETMRRDVIRTPAGGAVEPPSSRAEKRQGRAATPARSAARSGYSALIARHAAANGVPYELADAVVRIESRYNPRAYNAGALGLMQIKARTARGVGFRGPASALFEPETNIRYGVRYLAQAYRLAGGDLCGTVMRYQSGHYARGMSAANRAYCSKARVIMASM